MSLVVCLCCLVLGFSTFRTRLVTGPTPNFIMFADFLNSLFSVSGKIM